MAESGIFEQGLERHPANHVPLTPLDFLERSAAIYPERLAVVDGERRFSYAEFHARCHRLASALAGAGVKRGDTVTVMAPNGPVAVPKRAGSEKIPAPTIEPTTMAVRVRRENF